VTSQAQYYNPKGPQPGDSPADVVNGFLVAMTATPLQTVTAREFLTPQAQSQWQPQRVVTYVNRLPLRGTHEVVVRLRAPAQVGTRGQWQGSLSRAAARLTFPMLRVNHQWRIASVPNALIVPRNFYDQQYQEAEIYFFDPSGRILVPEPVHLPQGSQLATTLVRALLRGPSAALSGVVRSFLPPGVSTGSVPVSADGVADVTLKGTDLGQVSHGNLELIIAQLAWTLRQDASVHRFRLTIAGHQVADTNGAQPIRTDTAARFDPADYRSSSQFYALRRGLLVSGQTTKLSQVDGPFGVAPSLGLQRFAVSLDGIDVAGVDPNGLLVAGVNGPSQATRVLTGPGLIRPAWDFAGRVWDIQNTPGGARVLYVRDDLVHRLRVPGITGARVSRFLVSRDGSRLIAVLRGSTGDRIVVSRIRYDANDQPQGGTRARRIPWVSSASTRVRDIGWTSPTTIEVLDRIARSQSEARILDVDGSTLPTETGTVTISGHAVGLATSPVDSETPYAVLPHLLYSLASVDTTATTVQTSARTHHFTYAG
jgi:hypothetical protein